MLDYERNHSAQKAAQSGEGISKVVAFEVFPRTDSELFRERKELGICFRSVVFRLNRGDFGLANICRGRGTKGISAAHGKLVTAACGTIGIWGIVARRNYFRSHLINPGNGLSARHLHRSSTRRADGTRPPTPVNNGQIFRTANRTAGAALNKNSRDRRLRSAHPNFLADNSWRFGQETFESLRCGGLITSPRARSSGNF
jgi:hypothetical protein